MSDENTNPEQTPAPTGARVEQGDAGSEQTAAPTASGTSGRFAVYDTRYQRFVGSVTDKRPSKADARKVAGHDDVEVREV